MKQITNNNLNTILPKSWKRLDEYTIIASILREEDFSTLIVKAEPLNKEYELHNN
jgi:hypothetical protein